MAANEGHVIYLWSMGATKPLPGMRQALPANGFGLVGRGWSRTGRTGREHSTGRGEHSTPRQGPAGGGQGLLRPHPTQGSAAPLPKPSQQGKRSPNHSTKQTHRDPGAGRGGAAQPPDPRASSCTQGHPGAPSVPPFWLYPAQRVPQHFAVPGLMQEPNLWLQPRSEHRPSRGQEKAKL